MLWSELALGMIERGDCHALLRPKDAPFKAVWEIAKDTPHFTYSMETFYFVEYNKFMIICGQ